MNPDPSLSHIFCFLCLSFFLPGEKIPNAPHRLRQCKPGNIPFRGRLVLSIESKRLERLADIVSLIILNHIPLELLLKRHISHRNYRAQQFYQATEIDITKYVPSATRMETHANLARLYPLFILDIDYQTLWYGRPYTVDFRDFR
jgi:hypothetical protein